MEIDKTPQTVFKTSKPYTCGEYSEIFEASERMAMEPSEAYAYSQSWAKMDYYRKNLDCISRRERREGREEGMKKGREEGLKEGLEQGLTQGIAQGLEQGLDRGKMEVAEKMLKAGMDYDSIAKFTGLDANRLRQLNGC